MTSQQELEGDGINVLLFQHLWAKDELNFGPSINIPDTIIYKFGQPVAWYFTSVDGKIKKKNKNNLINVRIEETFSKKAIAYDVVACYISADERHQNTGDGGGGAGEGGSDQRKPPPVVEYLDRAALHDFLYTRWKESNGILQRFIDPKGTKNAVIRAIWSPKICLLERRENIHQLHDSRHGMYERCITYEGPEYYSTAAPVRGNVLPAQVQKICESVVAHIAEVTFQEHIVTRAVLNFKVDARDRVWLMYSTSIRCAGSTYDVQRRHDSAVNIDAVLQLPRTVTLRSKPSHSEIVAPRIVKCLSCGNESTDELLKPVPYKTVIEHFDHVILLLSHSRTRGESTVVEWPPDPEIIEAAGGVGFAPLLEEEETNRRGNRPLTEEELKMPPLMRHLHPTLSLKGYLRYRRDPLFLYKTTNVCENCFLAYAEFAQILLQVGGSLKQMLLCPPPSLASVTTGGGAGRGGFMSGSATQADAGDEEEWLAISQEAQAQAQSRRLRSRGRSRRGQGRAKSMPSLTEGSIETRNSGLSGSQRAPPSVPDSIRSANEIGAAIPFNTSSNPALQSGRLDIGSMSLSDGPSSQMTGGDSLTSADADGGGDPTTATGAGGRDPAVHTHDLQQRENEFFREMAGASSLEKHHPLAHMVAAQEQMRMIDEQERKITAAANQTDPDEDDAASGAVRPHPFGPSRSDRFPSRGYTPYRGQLQLKVIEDKQLTRSQRKSKGMTAAARKHQKFLEGSMAKVMAQVDRAEAGEG